MGSILLKTFQTMFLWKDLGRSFRVVRKIGFQKYIFGLSYWNVMVGSDIRTRRPIHNSAIVRTYERQYTYSTSIHSVWLMAVLIDYLSTSVRYMGTKPNKLLKYSYLFMFVFIQRIFKPVKSILCEDGGKKALFH